jgi:hypothetical protein
MKFRVEIRLSTIRAAEATVLLLLFAFAALGVVGAWR